MATAARLDVLSLVAGVLADVKAHSVDPRLELEAKLLPLNSLLCGDPMLDMALDAVDRGCVVLVRSPSGRSLWGVRPVPGPRRRCDRDSGDRDGAEAGVKAAESSGPNDGVSSLGFFTVLPRYCSCRDLNGGRWGLCSHVLAAAVADALGAPTITTIDASDDQLSRLIAGS